ncbi:helix-turn-helix domain-containing protein [Halobacteria archaeon AArc-m2/3/4]|uniref:Helix-turn-helix domain-containing protein n=1 Tax=Natronoglomus mannanivorans TaxID=2979990 RepID=A0ABT2QLG9_9EURY|nr:helix-turn-helix domain-containing protein [Halobacteria archaeon AArc-m2/3/4]
MGSQPPVVQATEAIDEPISLLLIDDDERWLWVTEQLLSETYDIFTIETATGFHSGQEKIESSDPDCIVCDHQLGDGTGLQLLTWVRERDRIQPFVLITGRGSEDVASQAISEGVTEYLSKSENENCELLVRYVLNAVSQYRTETALQRERTTNDRILELVTATTDPESIFQQLCQLLIDEYEYRCVWIGQFGSGTHIVPRAAAGETRYLDLLLDTVGLSYVEDDPALLALRSGENVIVHDIDGESDAIDSQMDDGDDRSWTGLAAQCGFGAAAGIPIERDGACIGVLGVYGADASVVSETHQQMLATQATIVNHLSRVGGWKQSLLSNEMVRVDLTIRDDRVPLLAAVTALPDCNRIEVQSVTIRDNGRRIYHVTTENYVEWSALTDTVVDFVAATTHSPSTATLETSTLIPEEVAVDNGAVFDRSVIENNTVVLSIRIPDGKKLSPIVDALRSHFGQVSVSRKWRDPNATPTYAPNDPIETLTGRQREVLQHAYYGGYFDFPRNISATEIAEQFGVSQPTVSQHLRAAEQKVFSRLFERTTE